MQLRTRFQIMPKLSAHCLLSLLTLITVANVSNSPQVSATPVVRQIAADVPVTASDYFERGKKRIGNQFDTGATDPDGGIADYGQAIKLDPELWKAYLARACFQYDRSNYQSMIEDLDVVIKARKAYELPQAYLLRSIARYKLGDNKGAISDYNQSMRWDNSIIRLSVVCNTGVMDESNTPIGEIKNLK
jgi:hypothetical protein